MQRQETFLARLHANVAAATSAGTAVLKRKGFEGRHPQPNSFKKKARKMHSSNENSSSLSKRDSDRLSSPVAMAMAKLASLIDKSTANSNNNSSNTIQSLNTLPVNPQLQYRSINNNNRTNNNSNLIKRNNNSLSTNNSLTRYKDIDRTRNHKYDHIIPLSSSSYAYGKGKNIEEDEINVGLGKNFGLQHFQQVEESEEEEEEREGDYNNVINDRRCFVGDRYNSGGGGGGGNSGSSTADEEDDDDDEEEEDDEEEDCEIPIECLRYFRYLGNRAKRYKKISVISNSMLLYLIPLLLLLYVDLS